LPMPLILVKKINITIFLKYKVGSNLRVIWNFLFD